MTCHQIDERLLALTAADPDPSFSDEESDHLRTCPRCREQVGTTTTALSLIARASADRAPDQSYWSSVLPGIRKRAELRQPGPARFVRPVIVRAFAPAAAVVVLAIYLSVATDGPPATISGGEMLAALSDDDLHELRRSGKDAALLEPADQEGGVESSVAEFIADLLTDGGDQALTALSDPEELLRQVDEEQFTEIVSLLANK